MRRRTEQKSEIYLRSALLFNVYKIDAPSISCTVPFGNTTVTFVISPSCDSTASPSPSRSHSVFARYSPIPVEEPFVRSDPVKPFSKIRGRSEALMPQPLSLITRNTEVSFSSLYMESTFFGLSKYFRAFWMICDRIKLSYFSSVKTETFSVRMSSSTPASRK